MKLYKYPLLANLVPIIYYVGARVPYTELHNTIRITNQLFTGFPGGKEGVLTDQETVCATLFPPQTFVGGTLLFQFQITINLCHSVRARTRNTLLTLQAIIMCSA